MCCVVGRVRVFVHARAHTHALTRTHTHTHTHTHVYIHTYNVRLAPGSRSATADTRAARQRGGLEGERVPASREGGRCHVQVLGGGRWQPPASPCLLQDAFDRALLPGDGGGTAEESGGGVPPPSLALPAVKLMN